MAQGVGVRCGAHGIRILGIEREGESLQVTKVAAGPSAAEIHEFVAAHMENLEDARLAYGLGPGDFLTACIPREEDMDDDDVRDQLRWEIERKIISNINDYSTDYSLIGDVGFVFAGRKKLISFLNNANPSPVCIDVEPVAVLNGCEAADDFGQDSVLLVSIEAEGVSSIVLTNGILQAIDSFPIDENENTPILAGQSRKALEGLQIAEDDRIVHDIFSSIERITSLGANGENPTPERIVLSGPGAYSERINTLLKDKYSIPFGVSDPFSKFTNNAGDISPELAGLSAAYTSCLGLALRAMETD